MIVRLAMMLLIAAGLTGFGLVAWLGLHQPPAPHVAEAPKPVVKRFVLVAAQPLRAGSLIKPEDLDQKGYDPADVPQGATEASPLARSLLYGAMARRSVAPGEPILPLDVMRPGDHGFLAAVLAPGMRAVTIDFNLVASAVNLIWPGDHVDMVLTQQNDPTANASRRIFGETVLTDIRVLAIDQQLIQGVSSSDPNQSGPRTVTVEVTSEQAERLAVALRLGKVSFAVRSAAQPQSTQVPGAARTIWAGDVSPALATTAPAPEGKSVHVWQGADDQKEFRY